MTADIDTYMIKTYCRLLYGLKINIVYILPSNTAQGDIPIPLEPCPDRPQYASRTVRFDHEICFDGRRYRFGVTRYKDRHYLLVSKWSQNES